MYTFRIGWLCLAAPLWAQPTVAELRGTVQDPAAAPIVAALVEVTHLGNGLRLTSRTGGSGEFHFLALPPGDYLLTASHPGFLPVDRTVGARVGEPAVVQLELPLSASSGAIEVTAAEPLLQSSRGTVGFVLDQRRVVNLPLDGRNFVPLLALSPGVSLPPGSLLPRINGSRPRVSEYLYDGISVLQPEPGQVAFYPIIDAIAEVRVETNSYSAEYGRSNGGVILVSQKAGTNIWRGSLFEFFRHEKLNARNLFATEGPRPHFRRNQYGAVLGGPVQPNRTFLFGAWQGTQLNTGVVRTSTVPNLDERRGFFRNPVYDPATAARAPFPGNSIPLSRFDEVSRKLLTLFPAPLTAFPANNYRRVAQESTNANQFDSRADRYFGERHRFFARYSFLRDLSRSATPLPADSQLLSRADGLAAEHTWSQSAAAVNQVRFGYTTRRLRRASWRGQTPLVPNLPVSSFADVLPTFDISGWQPLGPAANSNANFMTSVTQLVEQYSRVTGRHSWKAGLDARWEHLNILQPPSPTGIFQFTNVFTAALSPAGAVVPNTGSSLASFLLGQVNRFSLDSQPETIRPRAKILELFAQDDWRLTKRITLNAGVRYTLNFPSTVEKNQGAVFNLATQQLDFLGANGFPRTARRLEKANFAPRLGLAIRLSNSSVWRVGYALTWIEQAGITTPFTTPLFPFIETLGQESRDNRQAAFLLSDGPTVRRRQPGPDSGLGQGVFAVQRDNGSGYAQQWNASFQQTFGKSWSTELGYLGSKLTRLGVPDTNLNQLTAAQLALGPALLETVSPGLTRAQLLRPYPRFSTVALYRNNTGHSTYHSLQARLEKRFSARLSFSAAYTYSRLIDDAGAVFDSALLSGPVTNFQAADSFNKRLEKDVSTGNIPHNVSSGLVYVLPSGWQVAMVARIQSGSPVAVTQATNLNAFAGFGIQRPNRLRSPAVANPTTGRWFDPAAFTAAPQFTLGNSSRNPVIGPGYRTCDLMLGKTFSLNDRTRLEFRAEAFNVTNTPPLGNPNGSFGNAAFGSITVALDPRVLELVLKLHF
ncbi:MAG: TonB-dependent receptor [Bryobacteraceae bacterium]|nr:TonB-dependent receptor [Bryobacteraceae bacterium]